MSYSSTCYQFSCRKISDIVSALSTNEHAISLLVQNNSLDLAFLRGSSAEIGVVPIKPVDKKIDDECIIARNIWDGHWREELCAMYTQDHHLAFYAPLTKKPSLVLCFEEIVAVRKCDPTKGASPLPGFHLLSIDTAWRCHYIAFREDSEREVFFAKINDAYFHMPGKVTAKSRHAQEWESFQMSLETSLTGLGVRGKWALVSTGKKSKQKKQRRILNGRRMSFDIDSITKTANNGEIKSNNAQEEIATYVENLLKIALSFSPDALESTQSRFMEFLDEASRLRSLPLHEIDLFSEEAFCIFVNLYHCLLQHALLLAVDGLPDKVSSMDFSPILHHSHFEAFTNID